MEKLQSLAEDDNIDIYKTIVEGIPWHNVKLTSISICAESVWGIIENRIINRNEWTYE